MVCFWRKAGFFCSAQLLIKTLFYSETPEDLSILSGNINVTEGGNHKLVRAIMHEDFLFGFQNSFANDIAIVEVKN
jgi:hypothetical protein